MSTFIKNSNLPEGKVSSLICGGLNNKLISYFKERDIEIYYTRENKDVDTAIAKHCDISALYLGDGNIALDSKQTELCEELKLAGMNVLLSEKAVSGKYPDDCILNHTLIGNTVIGKKDIFDKSLVSAFKDKEILSVKQGYCKCSVLVVDERSVITDDESIARKMREDGFDCLLIRKGDISLDGHEYGFIGGASGKISDDEMIFFGDVTKHQDYESIRDFICERKIEIIKFDFPLTDFGGIIPIKENKF